MSEPASSGARSRVLPTTVGMSLPEAAQAYAAAGSAVFPCVPGGKAPLTRHGLHDASTRSGRVTAWWHTWPEANIGLATGGDGFDVLDIDLHPSGSGFGGFDRLRRAGLVDGGTHLVRTPSGGIHAYYPADPDRPQRSWGLAEAHIDFRGAGGYVVAPPSLVTIDHDDAGAGAARRYAIIATGTHSAPLDAGAVRDFLAPPRPHGPGDATPGHRLSGRSIDRVVAWLDTQTEGNRNRALYWAACRFAEHHVPEPDAHATLAPTAEQAGLPAREIHATITSAYRTIAPATGGMPSAWRRNGVTL